MKSTNRIFGLTLLIAMSVVLGCRRGLPSSVGESDEGGQQLVFIRAPQITHVADGVDVILHCHGQPVLVRQGNIMAATFHPEMGDYRCVADFLSAD